MKVIFRVDASNAMGIGHLVRCLTLAQALSDSGAQISFICRELDGNLIALLHEKALPVTVLPAPKIQSKTPGKNYANWLCVTQEVDAEETIEALNNEKPDWLIVDHYGLDIEWENRLSPYISNLMVIDDLANRHHKCDVLLDQNYSAEGVRRYENLVEDNCKILVGPRFSLLRSEYADYRRSMRTRDGQIRNVLVFFGGSDQQNMTGMALDALSHPEFLYLNVDIVIGTNNTNCDSIEQQVLQRAHTTLHRFRPHLADLMVQADLALGAGGTTTSERLCLGLPSLVVSIAENQIPSCKSLHSSRFIEYLGHQDKINTTDLVNGITNKIENPSELVNMSLAGQNLVDGLGTVEIIDTLGCIR